MPQSARNDTGAEKGYRHLQQNDSNQNGIDGSQYPEHHPAADSDSPTPSDSGPFAPCLKHMQGRTVELHPKSWTRKSMKGVQKSMGKELFSEELKLAVVQYVPIKLTQFIIEILIDCTCVNEFIGIIPPIIFQGTQITKI